MTATSQSRYAWYADFLRRAGLEPKSFEEWSGTVERYTMTSAEIDEAVKSWRPPSDAQREAENYHKPKIRWQGLTISIENPRGTKRRPEWKPLAHHYGYINRTEDRDGDAVDVYMAHHPESEVVFVVDQEHPSGRFDEHKVVLGTRNKAEARAAYLANYQDGWHCGPITALTIDQFKQWLQHGDTTKRAADQVSRYTAEGTPERYFGFSPPRPRDAHGHFMHVWRPDTEAPALKPPAPVVPTGPLPARVVGNPPQDRGWIGIDLDGTLARWDEGQGLWKIGEPIPEMVARVKRWLAEGRDVRILTARVHGPDAEQQRRLIEEWCRQYIGRVLPVTNQKDPQMYQFWDDRAIQVARNTGTPVGRFGAEASCDLDHDVQQTADRYSLSASETRELMDRYCGLVASELTRYSAESQC